MGYRKSTATFNETETLLTQVSFGKFKSFDEGCGSGVIEVEKV